MASVSPFPHLDADELDDVDEMTELFKLLANPSRLRIVHTIHRDGPCGPTEIAERLDLSPQVVSNQLRRLSDQHIVEARRHGREVHYRLVDPCVPGLLDLAVCLLSERT